MKSFTLSRKKFRKIQKFNFYFLKKLNGPELLSPVKFQTDVQKKSLSYTQEAVIIATLSKTKTVDS